MEYPKQIDKNELFRINILQKAQKDKEIQSLLLAECKDDILFFFNVFGWTYDPRKEENGQSAHIPFITYDFQDKFITGVIQCIRDKQDNTTEKSRDMGYSWMVVVIQVWAFIFQKWSSLYGSYKEDYVDKQGDMDSHFERIRYVLGRLPKWMKPEILEKFKQVSTDDCSISGDTGENFGTGGRRKFVVLDEFALWQNAEKAFRKTRDVSQCRIIGGTPEGRFNVYGKIMTSHEDYAHLSMKKFRLHWSDHPNKTQVWYENEKKNRTPLETAKELDISYDDSVTGAVYKDFQRKANFGKYEFDPELQLYTSWDFGRDMTAIIWIQKDFKTNTCKIIDSFQKTDKDIDFFAAFVNAIPTPGFEYTEKEMNLIEKHQKWKSYYLNHFGDPYNAHNRNVISENTIVKQLSKYGISIQTKSGTLVADRIGKTILALPRYFVDENQLDFIQAITQARYPEVKEGSQRTREQKLPIHNATSHFRTALEYWVDNEPFKVAQDDVSAIREYRAKMHSLNSRK